MFSTWVSTCPAGTGAAVAPSPVAKKLSRSPLRAARAPGTTAGEATSVPVPANSVAGYDRPFST